MSNQESKAIFSKWVDFLCVGGLSVVLMSIFLLMDVQYTSPLLFGNFVILTTLINAPHFMVSYKLLYGSSEMVKTYRWASTYLPIVMLIYCGIAVLIALGPDKNAHWANLFLLVMGYYLAVHYTGQTWGMMASFAYLDGVKPTDFERSLFRSSLHILMGWQLVWFSTTISHRFPSLAAILPSVKSIMDVVAVIAAVVGFLTFAMLAKRTKRIPPVRMFVPYVALCMWYLLLNRYPNTLFWVQLSHALQYLIFPMRVELNRTNAEEAQTEQSEQVGPFRHMMVYYCLMMALGYVVFFGVEDVLVSLDSELGIIAVMLTAIVNIHHYFIDGCVWKISNPEVRKDLFKHLG